MGSYQVVVTNGFGAVTSAVATLTVLNPPVPDSFNPGSGTGVYALALQPDGKILAGGAFTTLAGQSRSYIGRLSADGGLDAGFNPSANNYVYSLVVQTDGRILVGGYFTALGGTNRNYLGRLNGDGGLDNGFNPGANGIVFSLVVQTDGKILLGGNFTKLGGQPRNYLGRLNADGSLDTLFNPGAGGPVYAIALQPDGRILVGGIFNTLGGTNRTYLGRLNTDGSVDPITFNTGGSSGVGSLVLQADGKILVGGYYGTLAAQGLSRVNADGTLDTLFYSSLAGSYSLAVQTDGKILADGMLVLGRVKADGSLDTSFNPGANNAYCSLGLQPDGKVLVGGNFTALGGVSRTNIARLNNTQPATESLSFDGSTVTWLRGGTGPEVWRTTFEASTNGTDWIMLGAGARIPGGWQQAGLSLPAQATIRARGFCVLGEMATLRAGMWRRGWALRPSAFSRPAAPTTPALSPNSSRWAQALHRSAINGAKAGCR